MNRTRERFPRARRGISALLVAGLLLCASAAAAGPSSGMTLDAAQRYVEVPVKTLGIDQPQTKRFVRVRVAEVANPGEVPLEFEVRYQPLVGAATRLGSFALFPPTKPGEFLVAIGGRADNDGAIVVEMLLPADKPDAQGISVKIGGIALADQ